MPEIEPGGYFSFIVPGQMLKITLKTDLKLQFSYDTLQKCTYVKILQHRQKGST